LDITFGNHDVTDWSSVTPGPCGRRCWREPWAGAIAERYPELRCCFRDQVIFLAGGTRTVPLSDASSEITLARADADHGNPPGSVK
jgi:hypothetical protein